MPTGDNGSSHHKCFTRNKLNDTNALLPANKTTVILCSDQQLFSASQPSNADC